VLANLKTNFPDYDGRAINWRASAGTRVERPGQPILNNEYEKNLANFIRDVRKDLGVAKLPFVIAKPA